MAVFLMRVQSKNRVLIYIDMSNFRHVWFRGQTEISELFCELVVPPGKKNLVAILSQAHVLGAWKLMFY